MKNFIIGYGETLTSKVQVKRGSGDKKHPYSLEEARKRVYGRLNSIIDDISSKPEKECANGEVVIKLIQHPSYLAKTYYPKALLKRYEMKDIGSKPVRIRPDKWAVKNHPVEGLSSCIYISAKKDRYIDLLRDLGDGFIEESLLNLLRTIEDISYFKTDEKIKNVSHESQTLNLEVVIHASQEDQNIISYFENYIASLGGKVLTKKAKTVGGLTFLPVLIDLGKEEKLARFSHLRVLRSMPKLRFNKPEIMRTTLDSTFELPDVGPLNNDIKVCLLDGGLGDSHLLTPWATEVIPNNVSSSHPKLLAHGGEVCSSYLFGPLIDENQTLPRPYTKVDMVRVVSPTDIDPDLFDVLTRIENLLKTRQYKFMNLSLGPHLPIDDDEVHVWTSVLDAILQDGTCLLTVAVGNDGDLEKEFARIQPPSDMVNCLSVGACTSLSKSWERAPYSCIGPGRSPGIVKPDGVMFGGSDDELFKVYSPLTDQIIATAGTSFASPFALRVAAGVDALTDLDLMPSTIKALMVHHASTNGQDFKEVGWGRLPLTAEEVIECNDDEAIIVYQGELFPSQHVRIPVPLPEDIDCTWVHLKATFCLNTVTDPEHPLHYTRNGLDITFRPNGEKYKTREQAHSDPLAFFSDKKLYASEEDLRDDAHKWETCISRQQRFRRSTLHTPVFDVKHNAREQGAAPKSGNLTPIPYSLILSIRTEGNTKIYDRVLQENRTLQAVKVATQIRV